MRENIPQASRETRVREAVLLRVLREQKRMQKPNGMFLLIINDAVKNAFQWAKDMEKTNTNGTVIRIDDSDGYQRTYKIGNAEINITLTGGSKNYDIECGDSKNLSAKAHAYDSTGAADAKLESDDSSVLGLSLIHI
mgnify:CR=1 FL=1